MMFNMHLIQTKQSKKIHPPVILRAEQFEESNVIFFLFKIIANFAILKCDYCYNYYYS